MVNIPKFSFSNSKVVYFLLCIMLLGGVWSFSRIGKQEDAPFVIKSTVLITQYPGATPFQVEELITEPIEREVQTLRGVYKISSESFMGLSKISVELDPSIPASEIPQRWDELRRKTLNVQAQLPEGASSISVSDDFGDVFGIYYGLTADEGFTYGRLREIANIIKTDLVAIVGVQKVALYGEQTQVINVLVSTSKLASLHIDPATIIAVISTQNKLVDTGLKRAGELNLNVVAVGTYDNIDDIANQLITTQDGTQLRLGDFAQVQSGYLDPPSRLMRVNGKRAIGIGISTLEGENVVKIGERVERRLELLTSQIPIGMDLVPLYLENEIAQEANVGFLLNLLASISIVIFVIMLVMGLRSGLLIGSSLLFSIGGTMLVMLFMNVGLNRTSLAGFIIAMGMLVDNAIVVTDNAQLAIRRGVSRRKALIRGVNAPSMGLLGATFIGIISFLPLYLAPSAVAEIVKPLFVVLALSLSLSWFLAMSQTPLFGNFILKEAIKGGQTTNPYNTRFYTVFGRVLAVLIRFRWLTLLVTVLIFLGSMRIMDRAPQSFFPNLEKPYFKADCTLANGYSIYDTQEQLNTMARWLEAQPSVKNISITVGSSPLRYYLASTSFGPKANFGNILVELYDIDSTAILERRFAIYAKENFPNTNVRSMLFKLSPAVEAAIEIGFTGRNVDTLVMLADKAKDFMMQCNLITSINTDWGNKVPILEPVYSQQKGQMVGISRQSMADYVKLSTNGIAMGNLRQGDEFMPILLKDANINNFNLANFGNIPIYATSGDFVPMNQILDSVAYNYDYSVIKRYQRQKTLKVQCDPLLGANTKEAFAEVYDKVYTPMSELIPAGYFIKVFGEEESQAESNEALMANMPLTLLLIFLTLLLLFKDYRKPISILLMIPLILIGVVLGLALTGKMMDFFAVLGLIGLVGMNIKNAVVLVDQINVENKIRTSALQAVIEATKSRIVPVTMASGTTILGMLPLLSDALFGGMAATIMGGLLVASLLTLLIFPVTYCTLMRIK